MSKQHFHLHFPLPKTAVWQTAYGALVGLLVPMLLVFLVGQLLWGLQSSHVENTALAVGAAHSEARIKPAARLTAALDFFVRPFHHRRCHVCAGGLALHDLRRRIAISGTGLCRYAGSNAAMAD